MNNALLEKILTECPKFHMGETEIAGTFAAGETSLRGPMLENIQNNLPACYGVDPAVARFCYESVSEGSRTLETGSGISTLMFALRGAKHIAVTPNASEAEAIRKYAGENGISLNHIEFAIEPSQTYLPRCPAHDLDLVLIDGKHAFPWPIIDWFYTADKLKDTGILILDDLQMWSVSILRDFIVEDPHWQVVKSFGSRTVAIRKIGKSVHDVAWHMQPFITRRYGRRARLLNALGLRKR